MTGLTLFGYIDAGSGFILLQVLLAGALGGVFFFQRMFRRIINLVTGRGQRSGSEKDKPQLLPVGEGKADSSEKRQEPVPVQ